MPTALDKQIRRRRALLIIFLVVLALLAALSALFYLMWCCPPPPTPGASSNLKNEGQSPPFATKEPQRYQATRISTSSSTGSEDDAAQASSSRVLIARDGDRRREDYDLNGIVVSYLELSSTHYALLPAQRIYVDLGGEPEAGVPAELASEFSPDRLLNQSLSESSYEVLGNEILNGRATTRYRVTARNIAEANSLKAETLIWVDQSLGMPIKSETTVTDDSHVSKFTTEFQGISEATEPGIFELPPDFKKVSYKEFERQLKLASRFR